MKTGKEVGSAPHKKDIGANPEDSQKDAEWAGASLF